MPFGVLTRPQPRDGCQKRDLAARLFNRFDGRGRCAGDAQRDLGVDLALGQHADAVALVLGQASRDQRVFGDLGFRVQLAGGDELLDQAEVHDGEFQTVRLGEAALRQAAIQRHLAAFVATQGDARTGLLTLDTTAGGLALARARATRNALFLLRCAVDCRRVHAVSCRILLCRKCPCCDGWGKHGVSWLILAAPKGHRGRIGPAARPIKVQTLPRRCGLGRLQRVRSRPASPRSPKSGEPPGSVVRTRLSRAITVDPNLHRQDQAQGSPPPEAPRQGESHST